MHTDEQRRRLQADGYAFLTPEQIALVYGSPRRRRRFSFHMRLSLQSPSLLVAPPKTENLTLNSHMLEAQREMRLENDIRRLATLEATLRQPRRRRRRRSPSTSVEHEEKARHPFANSTMTSVGACRPTDGGSTLVCSPATSSVPSEHENATLGSLPHGGEEKKKKEAEETEDEEHEELPKFETLAPFAFSRSVGQHDKKTIST